MTADPPVERPDHAGDTLLSILQGRRADDLYDAYAHLRATAPLFRYRNIWAVTRYADCQAVMRDRVLGKGSGQAFDLPGFERREELDLSAIPSLLFLNPPDHTRLRRLVSRAFTPRRVEALRPIVDRAVATLLDELAEQGSDGGSVDLMETLAFQLPIQVIGDLIGVPAGDRELFRRLVPMGSKWIEPGATEVEVKEGRDAALTMITYFGDLLRERRNAPQDDLFTALIEVRDDDGTKLSRRELIINTIQLFSAGFHTTQNMIGNGLWALLDHPDAFAALGADPSILPLAVEELLRFDTVTQAIGRMALEPTTIGGQPIAEGEWVLAFLGSANRDPAAFDEPDVLRLTRTPNDHLSFSAGVRHCLGASLARMELGLVFGAVAARFPGMTLARVPTRREGMLVRGPARLEVRW